MYVDIVIGKERETKTEGRDRQARQTKDKIYIKSPVR